MLPGRMYKGIKSNSNTKRHFVDRFPIFIPCGSESLFLPLAPTFVYCDFGDPGLFRYIGHLRTYERLLNRLPAFNFVYASATDAKFKRAAKFFARLFMSQSSPDAERLIRYFKIRRLWEDHKTSSLTRPDRQLLRDGDQALSQPGLRGRIQAMGGREALADRPQRCPRPSQSTGTQTVFHLRSPRRLRHL